MAARTLVAVSVVALVVFQNQARPATRRTSSSQTSTGHSSTSQTSSGQTSTGLASTSWTPTRLTSATQTQPKRQSAERTASTASLQKTGHETAWARTASTETLWEDGGGSSPSVFACPGGVEAWVEGEACGVSCAPALCQGVTWQAFGDFLYLRPGSDKIAYAVPINGAIGPWAGAPPVQVGREATVDCGFDSGFRTGLSLALDSRADMGVTYTHFDTHQADQISIDVPYVLRSLVNHPGTRAAPSDFLDAAASYDVDFDLGDVDYRRILLFRDLFTLQYLVGVRYAHLEQDFRSQFSDVGTVENVRSNVDFDGGGIRVGLEAERHSYNSGLVLYGRGVASFLGGEFRGRYTQGDNIRGGVVDTGWREDRVVPILDLELGVGWGSPNGRARVTAGYLFSGWFNVVQADGFIDAVRSNNSVTVGDTLTFDGMMIRGELRF